MIRSVEHTPDTVITLITDYKVVVRDTAEQILDRIIQYQKQVRGDVLGNFLSQKIKED